MRQMITFKDKNTKFCLYARYNFWTIIDETIHINNHFQKFAYCQCDCGKVKLVILSSIFSGRTKHCSHCRLRPNFYKHGMNETSEWYIRRGMISRCYNEKDKDYHKYGARGIYVCQRWLDDFNNFYDDMGPRPSKDYSIERVDNNKGYEPNNCKWATLREQGSNKCNNVRLTFNGENLTVAQWSAKTGINHHTIYRRVNLGWPAEQIFNTPVKVYKNKRR